KLTVALATALPVAAVPDIATVGVTFPPPQLSRPIQAFPPQAASVAREATQIAASAGRTKHA
ncbi:hypothetical protein, partial [Paraburkholderia sp. Cpub6]|uniref:hypothetical protein n=1 Tax=Paraburkholderia sp. Cpub6 TaxID=2723094 RepID=UPI001C84FB37